MSVEKWYANYFGNSIEYNLQRLRCGILIRIHYNGKFGVIIPEENPLPEMYMIRCINDNDVVALYRYEFELVGYVGGM